MSDQSAIRMLQAAIENVRENCTGSDYRDLLAACDACDKQAEKSVQEDEPSSLQAANSKARETFAEKRKSVSDDK